MLKLKNITKIYQLDNQSQVKALNNVSIDFRQSEFVSILGPSGCGKTTLLNIIGGLDHYTEGDLLIDNKSIYTNTQKDFENEVSFAVFNPINDTTYNDVKITVAIWLEGYDCDYISTVDLTDLSFYLSFCKKERA